MNLHPDSQPDLALLRLRADDYMDSHPTASDVLLIVEEADSSLLYDRQIELPLYARQGIPEVWLIDPVARSLSRHAALPNDAWPVMATPVDETLPVPTKASFHGNGCWRYNDTPAAHDSIAARALPQAVLDLQAR